MTGLQHLIARLALPEAYAGFVSMYLRPVAALLDARIRNHGPLLMGINGSQGSGKSTAAFFLQHLLQNDFGHPTAVLSIDDFYHDKATRQAMARTHHPLFATRGVPGTHHVGLALDTITALGRAGVGQQVDVPRFDKARDERRPRTEWEHMNGPFAVVILEGWCVGAPPLDDAELDQPLNELERREDPDGCWRRTYNGFLATDYQGLFGRIDWLLMLKAPDFSAVYGWRLLQEQKLARTATHGDALLDEAQLQRFIQHYQRLTEHCLRSVPDMAHAVIDLDEQHRMTNLTVHRT